MSTTPPGAPDLVAVELRDLPVAMRARAQEHSDELRRELTLVAEQMRQRGDTAGLPHRLIEIIGSITGQYSMFTVEQEQQLAAALRSGVESVDVTYRIPRSAADAAASLGSILDEADEYCRAGRHLLTLATPPDLVTYRRWFLAQFVDQIAGHPPVPWPQYASLRPTPG